MYSCSLLMTFDSGGEIFEVFFVDTEPGGYICSLSIQKIDLFITRSARL